MNTSVEVDVELTEIRKEIAAIIRPFSEKSYKDEVGLLQMAAFTESIDRHANCKCLIIYKLVYCTWRYIVFLCEYYI